MIQILFISRSTTDAEKILLLFHSSGMDVSLNRVESAPEAAGFVSSSQPDVILVDAQLSQEDVFSVLATLKDSRKQIPIVVISDPVGEEMAVSFLLSGAKNFLLKDHLESLPSLVKKELELSKERLENIENNPVIRTYLNQSQDMVYFKDLQGHFTQISQSLAETLGLENPDQAIGKSDVDFFAPEFAAKTRQDEENILRSGMPIISMDEKVTWADGHISWNNTTKFPYYDATGRMIGTYGLSRDVTLQVKAARQLEESSLFFQAILNAYPAAICVMDHNGIILLTNQYQGIDSIDNPLIPTDGQLGMNYLEICDSLDPERFPDAGIIKAKLSRIVDHKISHFLIEYPISSSSGGKRWYNARISEFRWKDQNMIVISHSDITQLKINKEQTDLQSAALASLINSVVMIDPSRTIEWANDAFHRLFEYSLDEVVGKPIEILLSKNHTPELYDQVWYQIKDGKSWRGEFPGWSKSGKEIIVDLKITPLKNIEGKITHYIANIQDILDQKSAERALQRERERYQRLFESIPVGVFLSNREGRILLANPAYIQMTGYQTMSDLEKLNIARDIYLYPQERDEFVRRMEADGYVKGFETHYRRKDGSTISVRTSGKKILPEGASEPAYEGIAEDVTEFRKSQMQLMRLVAAVQNATDAMLITDLSGKINYVNPAFEKLFGKDQPPILGLQVDQVITLKDGSRLWDRFLQYSNTENVWRSELSTLLPDQTEKIMDVTISASIGLDSELSNVVFILRDITQERMMEIERHQSRKLEAIGQLAAGIAHEINTPTQFIGNNLRFLENSFTSMSRLLQMYDTTISEVLVGNNKNGGQALEQYKEEIDIGFLMSEIPSAIEGSLSGVERVTKIVNAMKEFSHPGPHDKVMTNINHAIENTIIVSRNEWKYVADLVTQFDPDLPNIPCLVDEFNEVMLNLIKNSADAIQETREKGVLVMGKIEISTFRENGWLVIQVSDNGSGIPVAIQDKVFNYFFTTKEVGKGTGQGLAMAYDVIVNKHSGKIFFDTVEGEGTTFTIKLPVSPV